MKPTSRILLNKITDEVVISILNDIVPVLNGLCIDFFIVGAFARDIKLLEKGHNDPPKRKTRDIDLAVMVSSHEEYEQLKERIAGLSGYEPHPEEPYRFLYNNAYEIDFLPFGEIANEKDQVELKAMKAFVLDIPGFREVFDWVEPIRTEEGIELKVSPLAGIILLKIIAWDDRKEREKDIQDIAYILENFYLLHVDEIAGEAGELFEVYHDETLYFDENVSARYIGRQIASILKDSSGLLERVMNILKRETQDPVKSKMGVLMKKYPLESSVRIILQILNGIEDKKS